MALYHVIFNLEKQYSFFNRQFLAVDFLIKWLEELGIICLPDTTINEFMLVRGKKKLLLYNPHFHPDRLILSLGHELGHVLLGHLDYADVLFSDRTFFSKTGIEKDAGIIGFLCWLPTPWLDKMLKENRLSVGEVMWELKNCDTEEDMLRLFVEARLRIYKAYRKLTTQTFHQLCISAP